MCLLEEAVMEPELGVMEWVMLIEMLLKMVDIHVLMRK